MHSWPRVPREPTTAGLEDSGAQVCRTWLSLIDAIGYHLVPMYRVIRPTSAVALLVLFLVGILRMLLDIVIRAIAIARIRGSGWWLMGAFWGHRRGGRAIGSQDAAQRLGQARELVQRVPRQEGYRSGLFGTTPNRIGLLGKTPAVKHSFPSKSRWAYSLPTFFMCKCRYEAKQVWLYTTFILRGSRW